MKTVLLLRHAKSSWDNPALGDHERPLNKRGLKAAPRVGRHMADSGLRPDIVVSSTAVRARTTAEIVAQECGCESEVRLTDELYLARPAAYRHVLADLPEGFGSAMLVGHNPGISELLMEMSGELVDMPTGALAHIQFPVETWTDFSEVCRGELISFCRPRELD